jgi:uncharacterized protein (DUF1800 family)
MNRWNVDVDWAWAPYEPTQDSPWDFRAASHLYRRAGFGASWETISQAVQQNSNDVIRELVDRKEPSEFRRDMESLTQSALVSGNPRQLSAQWVYRMLHTPTPLREKMTLFLHGHFATSADKVNDAELMQQQNELLRRESLGDFRTLLLEISRDPAMLEYLDSASNRKAHPNENYAREIMELFCLGEGNYSEQDIRELARCFTGWEVKRKKFRLNRYQMDEGEKSVLGTTGQLTGEDGVQVVASQPHTPRFLVRKLLRFFLADDLDFSDELVEPLAAQFQRDRLQIAPVLHRMLGSNLFFSPYVRGRKVRSPVEFGTQLLIALQGTCDCFQLADAFERMGQGLYYPPSVKGWDGGRSWINSSTLVERANLIHDLLAGGKTRFDKQTVGAWAAKNDLATPDALIERLQILLLATELPEASRQRIVEHVSKQRDESNWVATTIEAVCTLPEYQLA